MIVVSYVTINIKIQVTAALYASHIIPAVFITAW